MTFPTRCCVDGRKNEVLYIKIKHIIADNCVICFNHTASEIGFIWGRNDSQMYAIIYR